MKRLHPTSAWAAVLLAMPLVVAGVQTALAVPTLTEVSRAARSGDLARADAMMQEVLKAHPRSARAHFVYAKVLAAQARLSPAQHELSQAQALAPGLPFADPRSVAELERAIAVGAPRPAAQPPSRGVPAWFWVVLAVAAVVILARLFMPRPVPSTGASQGYPGAAAGPVGVPGQAPVPGGFGGGGGFFRSILTGLGFGAGIAAGEYAVDKMLGGGSSGQGGAAEAAPLPQDEGNPGAGDFGVRPGDSSSGGWEEPQDAGADGDFGAGGGDGGWDDSSGGGGDI